MLTPKEIMLAGDGTTLANIETAMKQQPETRDLTDSIIQYDGEKFTMVQVWYIASRQIDVMQDREAFHLLSIFSSNMEQLYLRRVEAAQLGFKNIVVLLDLINAVREAFRADGYRAEIALIHASFAHISRWLGRYVINHGVVENKL